VPARTRRTRPAPREHRVAGREARHASTTRPRVSRAFRRPSGARSRRRSGLATDLAGATSGTYESGPRIEDPRTGLPATDLVSLTVIGPDIVAADVYATAVFAMGPQGLAVVEGIPGYDRLRIA